MKIHRFEKAWLAVSLLLIVGFIATVTYGAVGEGVEMIGDEGEEVDPTKLNEHPKFGDPGVEKTGPNEYAVYVVASQFQFTPGSFGNPIRVPTDANVTFYVTTKDVIHGFDVAGTNLNTMAIPGQVAEVTVRFDEPGEYGILCNEYCGSGHHGMEGKLVAVPKSQYEGGDGE